MRWPTHQVRDIERARRIGRYSLGSREQSAALEAYSDADWRGDKATRRSVSVGVIMGGGCHCPPLRANCTPQSEPHLKGWGPRALRRTWGWCVGLNVHLDVPATMCLVRRRRLGKAKHVDMQNMCLQLASMSGRFVTKEVKANLNPADLSWSGTKSKQSYIVRKKTCVSSANCRIKV